MSDYLSYQVDWSQAETVAMYDELPLWSAMFGLLLFKYLPLHRGMTVLDLGYGAGFPLLELAERLGQSSKVYGIDPWETARQRAIAKARAWQVTNSEPMQGDAAALPFPDSMFDLIVSNLGLNNFNDPRAAIRECWRVAKPGARLALTTNLQGHMQEFYAVYRDTLEETGRERVIPALEKHIAHRATVEGVKLLCEEAGFHLAAVQEETAVMRFLDGSALLRHHLIKTGFLDAWKELIPQDEQAEFFTRLEANLNRMAEHKGELALTIPMAYIEAEKVPEAIKLPITEK